jgi:tetratricopeptide (TPR) repeat protein
LGGRKPGIEIGDRKEAVDAGARAVTSGGITPLLRVFLIGLALAVAAPVYLAGQDVSPLPPPVTRSSYRSRWFEFLNAHLEDDAKTASAALADMLKTAHAVGIQRLSDFSRTAVHEGRKAEVLRRTDRARRAYSAALMLDSASPDAHASRIGFLVRQGSYSDALRGVPDLVASLFETRESRLALLSCLAVWATVGFAAAVIGFALAMVVHHFSRISHNLSEIVGRRLGGRAALPLVLIFLAIPFAFGLDPFWAGLCWSAMVFPFGSKVERWVLGTGLVLLGLLPAGLNLVARENIVQRSPLYVAAVDLEEQREDGSAEDGLRQASAVFAEDPDVWFLLGMYAERSNDPEKAIVAYDRAIHADPRDYRPFLNRGNVFFQQGDFAEAIRDYEAAAQRSPRSAEIYYNLSIARGEAYDFPGQGAAMAQARELSDVSVRAWTEHPIVARVVSASYSLPRALRKVEEWNAQPKSRRLPGHVAPIRIQDLVFSVFTLGPWVILALALLFAGALDSREILASECAKCGKAFCPWCKRPGDPLLYCSDCVSLHLRKEAVGIEAHVAQTREIRWRIRRRDWSCRLATFFLPGAHGDVADRPIGAFLTLFVFLFLMAVAGINDRFYGLRPLPTPHAWSATVSLALGLAGIVWLLSQRAAWRESHGS